MIEPFARAFRVLALLAVTGCSPVPQQPATAPATEPTTRLNEIAAEYWQLQIAGNLLLQRLHGAEITALPDLSLDADARRAEGLHGLLGRLEDIDEDALPHDAWIDHASLRWELEMQIEEARHAKLNILVTPYAFNRTGVEGLFSQLSAESPEDAERYLELAGQLPAMIDAVHRRTELQMEAGIVAPRAELELVLPMWESYAAAPQALFRPPASSSDFEARLAEIFETATRPALERLLKFLRGPYASRAPESVGIGQYPGGAEAYAFKVRFYTNLELDAAQVHAKGLELLERNNAEMAEIRRQLGIPDAATMRRKLWDDPRFYASTAEEIGEILLAHMARIEPRLDEVLAARPAAPYSVKRMNPAREGAVTYGYYLPATENDPAGYYVYNGSKLDERPLFGPGSLIAHELMPGHHYQLATTLEADGIPDFRRTPYYWGYAEGWGEYAAVLAGELGMYRTPLERYTRLAWRNFFACRLVVDTGMNALGWSRQQAIDLMREHTLLSESELASETLRYGVDQPGQALAYAIGREKILELRENARNTLGERFNLRSFHTEVVGRGMMPLTVLERHLAWWIAGEEPNQGS